MAVFSLNTIEPPPGLLQQEQAITPAAEWLVDNFYIVEEQLAGNSRRSCRLDSTANSQKSRQVIWKGFPAYSVLRGHMLRTPTAGLIPSFCGAS